MSNNVLPSGYKVKREKPAGFGNTRPNLTETEKPDKQGVSASESSESVSAGVAISIDYLRFSGKGVPLEDFNNIVVSVGKAEDWVWFYERPRSLGQGCPSFQNHALNPNGAIVLFTLTESSGLVDYVFDVSGTYLSRKSIVDVWRFCHCLSFHKVRFSRVDIAVTDTAKTLQICNIEQAIKDKNYAYIKTASKVHKWAATGEEFSTMYCGSRQSTSFVRVYDTKPKHGFDGIRYENELKRGRAREFIKRFIGYDRNDCVTDSTGESDGFINNDIFGAYLQRQIAKVALGAVDFRKRDEGHSNKSISSCPRLQWWQDFIDMVTSGETARIPVPATPRSIERTINWWHRQVEKTLAIWRNGLGAWDFRSFIDKCASQGSERLNSVDEYWIRQIKSGALSIS